MEWDNATAWDLANGTTAATPASVSCCSSYASAGPTAAALRATLNVTSNITRGYSPVTMNQDWPRLERLSFMVFCALVGTLSNGFFVAAFCVERTLRKVGNVFLACIGLADLILTAGVVPVGAVVLLSGEWDTLPVCHALQFLAETSTYCYCIFFALVALETYYRLCRTEAEYASFISMPVGPVSTLVFVGSFVLAGAGVYMKLDYDYCQRCSEGDDYFRASTSLLFHWFPSVVAATGLVVSAVRVRQRARLQPQYRRSHQFEIDCSTNDLNLTAFALHAAAWTPYLVVVHLQPDASDARYYATAWVGVCRSALTSALYSISNSSFRRAFAHLFNYCCCKSTLSGPLAGRHRRNLEYKPAGEVRVHIMHQAVNLSQLRAAAAARESQEL